MQAPPAASPTREQLHMIWPQERRHEAPLWPPPLGYSLRPYRESDEAAHIALMRKAGFDTWTEENTQKCVPRCLPRGFFMISHDTTATLVATAMTVHNPIPRHPEGGELSWVAGDPAHKGKGLGYAVCAAVTRRFLDAGYERLYLRTDDHRFAAIKVYVDLGYAPLLFAPDMPARWQEVCDQLGLDFGALRAVRE